MSLFRPGKAASYYSGMPEKRLNEEEILAHLDLMKKKQMKFLPFVIVFALAAVIGLAISLPPLFVIGLIAAIILASLMFSVNTEINRFLSDNIVRYALAEIIDIEDYSCVNHLSEGVISEAALINDWNEISGSDFFSGKYKGFGIIFSDIHLENVTTRVDSKGNVHKQRVTKFQGQWLVCETKKYIDYSLRLRENGERLFREGYQKSKSDIETENIAFNEKYQILTRDGHTAFYILTPHFMEYIIQADKSANCRSYLCFEGNKIHIALDTHKDFFRVRSGADAKNLEAFKRRIRGEIKFILDILDELMQNKNLFD